MTISEVWGSWRSCTACRLGVGCPGAIVASPWRGASDGPRVLVVGDAPTEADHVAGRAFSGPGGVVLRESVFPAAGLGPVLLTNGVACRPPQDRDPKVDEKSACGLRLVQLALAFEPLAVVTIGRHGADAWGRAVKRRPAELATLPVTSIRHPDLLLERDWPGPKAQRMFRADVAKLKGLFGASPAAPAKANAHVETTDCAHVPIRVGMFRKGDSERPWNVCAKCGVMLED